MKSVVRAVLGGKRPAQSKAERKFRDQYSLTIRDESYMGRPRWSGNLRKNNNTIKSLSGDSEENVRQQATEEVDYLWKRHKKPNERKVSRL